MVIINVQILINGGFVNYWGRRRALQLAAAERACICKLVRTVIPFAYLSLPPSSSAFRTIAPISRSSLPR